MGEKGLQIQKVRVPSGCCGPLGDLLGATGFVLGVSWVLLAVSWWTLGVLGVTLAITLHSQVHRASNEAATSGGQAVGRAGVHPCQIPEELLSR